MNTTILNSIQQLKKTFTATDPTNQIILRILAAVFGGYALTNSTLAALAVLLPWPKVDILFFSVLLPPFIYLAAILWSFGAPTVQRAWRDLLTAILCCGVPALIAAWLH
ncbi:hypothetical protein SPFL3102_03712 [Sporomusaceae bacterium FL31]|nr:hypothetical protein SPFL3101_02333 [Sporomusaceae bacterium FL31]GCE35855.1 hypothetical protein SPFL3102_03712 [Sporomusaceae bacterium]